MNHKDKALRIAFTAFHSLSLGNQFSQNDFATFADLCALALPMKYRFTKEELETIKAQSEAIRGINVLAEINAK